MSSLFSGSQRSLWLTGGLARKKESEEESLEIHRWFKPAFLSSYHIERHCSLVPLGASCVMKSASFQPAGFSDSCCRNNLLSAPQYLLGVIMRFPSDHICIELFFPFLHSVVPHLINPLMDCSWTWWNLRFLCDSWYTVILKMGAFRLTSVV